jgi:hypothetical protein
MSILLRDHSEPLYAGKTSYFSARSMDVATEEESRILIINLA